MKNAFITFMVTLIFPLTSFANGAESLPPADIQVVPLSTMYDSAPLREAALKDMQLLQTRGYIEGDEPYVKYLQNVKASAANEIQKNNGNLDPYDTHLKSTISEISLDFPSRSLTIVDPKKVIGFLPFGNWKYGWTGVKEFFEDNRLGICEFSKINRKILHGRVQLAAEMARHDVNSLPSILNVKGTQRSGFLYTVKWYDATFSYGLVCTNPHYDKAITDSLLQSAKVIATS